MATLNWIGKEAVVNHHREVPYRLLKGDASLSVGSDGGVGSGNLLVQGDNLEALKALLPYYGGKVKCIYIDPPYNTGNEGWVYNDNVNSPAIREWLKRTLDGKLKAVGKEGEDLSRHDKWLCMMYPRLELLKQFLSNDGVVFISIGKDEVGHLRVLCDEVFGRRNLLEQFIWQMEGNVENQEVITSTHEYVIAYERQPGGARANVVVDPNVDDDSKLLRDFAENSVIKNGPGNPASVIALPIGFPCAVPRLEVRRHAFAEAFIKEVEAGEGYITRDMKTAHDVEYPIRLDDMLVEDGELIAPCRVYSGWSSARKFRRFIELDCTPLDDEDGSKLRYFLSHTGVPTYRREARQAHFVPTILRNMGTTETASNELERMGVRFPYPKPVTLIKYLIGLYAKPGDTVLDSFAGSGTTGHAVLDMARSSRLRFVLVELDADIAQQKTAKRLSSAALGYSARRGRREIAIDGLGGGFRYVTLGPTLFDEFGHIRADVRFADLAAHVFFTETGEPIPKAANGKKSPFIGACKGTAYYLLFNGILGDKRPDGGNVLTGDVLADLPSHDGPRVVFGEACRLGAARLARERTTFKQIPYEVKGRPSA